MSEETDTPWLNLCACIVRIHSGPWVFIQLRGEALSPESADRGDVDFLGTRGSIEALSDAVLCWVRAGDCHMRLASRNRCKTTLTLFSTDGKHRIDFDLWVELWQLHAKSVCLRYADCEPLLSSQTGSIRRLPLAVEAAVYLHHLVSKRRDVTLPGAAKRLEGYRGACLRANLGELADAVGSVIQGRCITPATLAVANRILDSTLKTAWRSNARNRFGQGLHGLRAGMLSGPRPPRILSLMGCDGCGKTAQAECLKSGGGCVEAVFTGKHLYRKSLLYKLAVIVIRPLLFQKREAFDETLAPLIYLRACLGLQLKLWRRRRGLLVMDRSLMDFLMVDRKSDTPTLCRSRWLADAFGRRIPTVHLILPYEQLVQRKKEVTEAGHARYDAAMFKRFTRQIPTDYTLFNNSGGLKESAAALGLIVQAIAARND